MGEWWSYGVSDLLMFSSRTWYRMLELHNRAWWPLQPVAMVMGIGLLWAINRRVRVALRMGLWMLGLSMLFVAWEFHWKRYAIINLAAPWFALAFAIEGLLLTALGALRRDLTLSQVNAAVRTGSVLLSIAVLLYPVSLLMWFKPMEQSEWFGLAPDPTVMATLGLLLCLCGSEGVRRPRLTWTLLSAIPLAWCLVTGATLWALDASDWRLMPSVGVLAGVVGWWQSGLAKPSPSAG